MFECLNVAVLILSVLNTIGGHSTFLAALALTSMENLCFCLNEHKPK